MILRVCGKRRLEKDLQLNIIRDFQILNPPLVKNQVGRNRNPDWAKRGRVPSPPANRYQSVSLTVLMQDSGRNGKISLNTYKTDGWFEAGKKYVV